MLQQWHSQKKMGVCNVQNNR